jgi:PAS domain S-box-containing protein
MKNLFTLKWLKNVSIAKRLYFAMSIMALLIAIELFTLWFSVTTLSSVRAYVGGEGLWSKAQKDAIYHLSRYGHTRDNNEYNYFLEFMQVPQGDHDARVELEKPNPDYDVVMRGLLKGKNSPEDADGMIYLFRNFRSVSYIDTAVHIWSRAEKVSAQLIPIGQRLHDEITSANPSQEKIDIALAEIAPVNFELTLLEDDFSYTLGEGSRWLENLILKILFAIALTVEISSLLLTVSVSRSIQRGLKEIIALSGEIAKGNYKVRAKKRSDDELGDLAEAFNRMADELEHHSVEKTQSKELLKESEERFRLIVENIKDYLIVMTDLEGNVISWNEGAKKIKGYSEEEIIGKNIAVFFTDEDKARKKPERNMQIAKEKGHFQEEGWRKRKDGSVFWADVLLTAIYDKNGKMQGYAKIIRDITERKKAEIELRRNQQQLAMAQKLAHLGSWEWNLADNSLIWSEEMYNIYGLSQEEQDLVHKVNKMTHPEDIEKLKAVVAESKSSRKNFEFYYRIIRADGAVRTLHSRGNVILNENGEVEKIIGTDQDVTDRFREEQMEKLVMAATKSNNAVIIADHTGKIEWVNEGFTLLTGYSFDEVKDTHGELLRHGGATGLTPGTDLYETVFSKKQSVVYEGKNFTKSGNEYWVITTLTPVLGTNGEVERIIAIDSDITERKKFEEDMILANKIAEHSLKKGSKALQDLMRAKKQLEESMHVKEQFLAKMSHEIRTPMNAIVGLTDILLDSQITRDQRECVDAIKLSSDNLLSIINDILDFSKLESGKVSMESIPFNPREIIDAVLFTLGFSATKKGISLNFLKEENQLPGFVVGDSVRLRQIILNLLSNAIKFTEQGSVTIKSKTTDENETSCKITFEISDTGIGIPEDRIATIFESFTQASNETTRKYGGTGLGLTIVKQLVELQDGTVSVESKPGKGSTFYVTIPYKKYVSEDLPLPTSLKKFPENKLKGVRVLLAEDNEMNQMLATKIFTRWKLHLEVAENGQQAIEKLKAENFDIILMDIQMPLMDGYEATKYIRKNFTPPKSTVPIIAMTAHAMVGESDKCIAMGMDDYISKPFSQQDLYDKICTVLENRREIFPQPETKMEEKNSQSNGKRHIDLSYLKEISEGNNEFIKKMIRAYLSQTPTMLEDMSKSIHGKKWKDLRGIAHKMKPSLDFVGIHSIKQTVKDIETFSNEETHLELLPGMVEEVKATCISAMEELKHELEILA